MKISANLWYKATRFYRRILAPAIVLLLTIIVTVLPLGFGGGVASAAVGGTLATLLPSPSGNGRAVTIDPTEGHLYYTNYGDPHIYVIDTSGTALQTLNPLPYSGGLNIMYGALSWQSTSTGGILWGGRYDGSGWVDQINPNTGRITPAFRFSFPAGDSCYSQGTG